MREAAPCRPLAPPEGVNITTLPYRKGAGRVSGRKNRRISARLEWTEGFSTYCHRVRARAGAGAHVPFYTVNPSYPSIIPCLYSQPYKIVELSCGRVALSTLTPAFRLWKCSHLSQFSRALVAKSSKGSAIKLRAGGKSDKKLREAPFGSSPAPQPIRGPKAYALTARHIFQRLALVLSVWVA